MKDSWIALIIASILTALAVTPLYYSYSYYSNDISGYRHGKIYSKGHHGGRGQHGDDLYHILKFKEQLNLTEEQVTQINNLKFEYEKKGIGFQRDHEIAYMDIERALESETLNENKVRELASKIGDLKRRRIIDKFEAKLNVKYLLTTEQKKKVKHIGDYLK